MHALKDEQNKLQDAVGAPLQDLIPVSTDVKELEAVEVDIKDFAFAGTSQDALRPTAYRKWKDNFEKTFNDDPNNKTLSDEDRQRLLEEARMKKLKELRQDV